MDRYILSNDKYLPAKDGTHIIYVNGKKQGSRTELEKLMHDFNCIKPEDMYYPNLAVKMRFLKEEQKGVQTMGWFTEEIIMDVRTETALKMIQDGQLSLEKIAQYSNLTMEKIEELVKQMKTETV